MQVMQCEILILLTVPLFVQSNEGEYLGIFFFYLIKRTLVIIERKT